MAPTNFRFGYHSADKALCFEFAYYPAGKAGIHVGFSGKPADRIGAVPVTKQVTRDARTFGRENVPWPPALLEQIGAALDVNLQSRRNEVGVARKVDPAYACPLTKQSPHLTHVGHRDNRNELARVACVFPEKLDPSNSAGNGIRRAGRPSLDQELV